MGISIRGIRKMMDFKTLSKIREDLHVPMNAVSDETFKVRCRMDDANIEIMVTEEIGDDGWGGGVSADEIAQTLNANPSADVTVRINSPGGLAYDGLRIYNMLTQHDGNVRTIDEGLAYSAASIIFMAGDERVMYEASDFGIHRASGGGYGNQYMMLAIAEFLDGLDNHLIGIYAARAGKTEKQVTELIDGSTNGQMGTMLGGKDAVAEGFATELIPHSSGKAAAKLPGSKPEKQKVFPRRQAALARLAARSLTFPAR